ncbi:hypothetical protein Tco_0123377 [Tanacetum coccineum]
MGLWGSVPTIVVLESRSELEPRMLSYWILFYTVGVIGILLTCNAFLMNKEDVSKWFSVVQVGMNYVCSLLMIVQYVTANTVLFLQCQEARNEKAHADDVRVPSIHGGFSYMLYVFILRENTPRPNIEKRLVTGSGNGAGGILERSNPFKMKNTDAEEELKEAFRVFDKGQSVMPSGLYRVLYAANKNKGKQNVTFARIR